MPTFADYFDHIYVVNLPTRPDRKAEMSYQLARIGLSFDHPRVHLFAAFRPQDAGGFDSIGARGCFESHLTILRHAQMHEFNKILIFEDDLNFSDDFSARSVRIVHSLAMLPWQMFYGGYENIKVITPADENGVSPIPSDQSVQTTHFVGFQKPAINDAVRYLDALLSRPPGSPDGGPMHVDGAYSWFRRSDTNLVTLAATEPLGYQRASRTDIHELRWFDRTPLVRDIVGKLRHVRNKLR